MTSPRQAAAAFFTYASEFEACGAAAFNKLVHDPLIHDLGMADTLRAVHADECRHAALQQQIARELCPATWRSPTSGSRASFVTSRLATSRDAAWNATYTNLFEWRTIRQFRRYRGRFLALGMRRAADALGLILDDERRHVTIGRELLRQLPGVTRHLVHDVVTAMLAVDSVDRGTDAVLEQALGVGARSAGVTDRGASDLIEALAL